MIDLGSNMENKGLNIISNVNKYLPDCMCIVRTCLVKKNVKNRKIKTKNAEILSENPQEGKT